MTTLNGVLDAATRNACSSNDLAIAASQIIARRVAIGVTAAFAPLQADHAELGRILPEKLEAFSAAGMIMIEQTNQAGWTLSRLASDEVMTTAQATFSLASCVNPMAQGLFALDWFNRTASNFFTMGVLALDAQQAAMVPIQEKIAANAERLVR